MSGGSFSLSHHTILNTVEELEGFTNKQRLYRANRVNPHLPTGDYDHEFSEETLNKLDFAAEQLKKAATILELVDHLVSADASENSFNTIWNESRLGCRIVRKK